MKELDKSGLEFVKKDCEKRLTRLDELATMRYISRCCLKYIKQ